MTRWQDARVLVVGAGRTGAAVAAALTERAARVTVAETGAGDDARTRAATVARTGATVVRTLEGIDPAEFDLLVPSPGVVEHHPLLLAAAAAGTPVWSEPELAWRLSDGRTRLVAVTGTNGKTTTTEMIAACLSAPTAGNIGTPLVSLLGGDEPPGLVVAELSSFQLRFCHTLRPTVAVLLNVAPDHLDWHRDLDAYRAAKARIWAAQQPGDVAVVGADDPGATATAGAHPPPAAMVRFTTSKPHGGDVGVVDGWIVAGSGEPVVEVEALAARGPHNLANACAAVAAGVAAGADVARLGSTLAAYHPGRHRLETVGTVDGVTYVDDSKATNPHAAAAALASFPAGRVIWIAGGLGKGLDFDDLVPHISGQVTAAFTIGTSGPQIAEVVTRAGVEATVSETLDRAVTAAAAAARPGDVVLLAPACASMDQFTDYAERGEAFRAAVAALSAAPATGVPRGR